MPVPKKRTSISKKKIRKNFWKKKGYTAGLKAFSLAESIFTGNSKGFNSKGFGSGNSKGFNSKGFGSGNSKGFNSKGFF
uniref:Large ribosomal subunit protein bL32c n=2 Tax=Pisum sativum TaxID=3888 RepID=A0A2S1CEW3_PEA|nr:ribosomal protein L32 [Pisum abyssinicum]YP_009514113.1 ribosomal protein L32 [Pisum sativum subsp. elatius]AWD26871.1 ribosomal protein L32 [Pisum abyssinicum]AXK15399.1 ribosomal protein L32 [Pisum sativum subsp. elatius]AXY95891.1 ribosomal protein L32 [Pisum sativum subsp. elatius]AXY95965.1 ribosomal protein L32 [Pisum sativum subsp. elatius]QLM01328.1 ribosomal protein L32 [Pisum sativum subsp. elatius]